jgi:hypothetical protein
MSSGPKVIVYPANDIDQATSFYEALLGNTPEIDTPYYVQCNIGDQILGLDPNGHSRGVQGAAMTTIDSTHIDQFGPATIKRFKLATDCEPVSRTKIEKR